MTGPSKDMLGGLPPILRFVSKGVIPVPPPPAGLATVDASDA